MTRQTTLPILALSMIAACGGSTPGSPKEHPHPDVVSSCESAPPPPKSRDGSGSNGIELAGGPVLTGVPTVYYIWYGDWSKNPDAVTILEDFAKNLGCSGYWGINTTYYDVKGTSVQNALAFGGSVIDAYSQGSSIDDTAVQAIVAKAIADKAFPTNADAIYVVLTSADVQEITGFCCFYCGWHANAMIAGADIKYAFVGDPAQCPTACTAYPLLGYGPDAGSLDVGPNHNLSADGMANVIAHEAEETVTDPDPPTGWSNGFFENADLCAWTFGETQKTTDGASYNQTFGSREYLIQQQWMNRDGGYCATILDEPKPDASRHDGGAPLPIGGSSRYGVVPARRP